MEAQYHELHNQYREAFNIFLKGSSMGLAIIAFALGYLFKVPLDAMMSRSVSGFVIIVLSFWYVCAYWALKMYVSIVGCIEETSLELGYTFHRRNYSGFKAVILSGMTAVVFVVAIFVYLWINPPIVSPTTP